MSIKKLLLLVLLLFSISLFIPKTAQAFDLQETLTSENSIITKIQEGIEYFFAFKIENKILVLEKQAEKRLALAQSYTDKKNDKKLQSVMQDYFQIKEKQNNLLEKTNDGEVLGTVEERTIEQQKIMEEIKTKINEVGKQNVVKIQEQVVNQVGERIVEVNGKEGQTEFFNKVEHVWAPGTGPRGEAGTSFAPGTSGTGNAGIVIEGGSIQFAPGTSGGVPAGSDIKTVEVKTGGGFSDSGGGTTVEGGNPGTTSGGGGNTVESGGQNVDSDTSSDGSRTWIDP